MNAEYSAVRYDLQPDVSGWRWGRLVFLETKCRSFEKNLDII